MRGLPLFIGGFMGDLWGNLWGNGKYAVEVNK